MEKVSLNSKLQTELGCKTDNFGGNKDEYQLFPRRSQRTMGKPKARLMPGLGEHDFRAAMTFGFAKMHLIK